MPVAPSALRATGELSPPQTVSMFRSSADFAWPQRPQCGVGRLIGLSAQRCGSEPKRLRA